MPSRDVNDLINWLWFNSAYHDKNTCESKYVVLSKICTELSIIRDNTYEKLSGFLKNDHLRIFIQNIKKHLRIK